MDLANLAIWENLLIKFSVCRRSRHRHRHQRRHQRLHGNHNRRHRLSDSDSASEPCSLFSNHGFFQALSRGPLLQFRTMMSGVNIGISCIMKTVRGKVDVQSRSDFRSNSFNTSTTPRDCGNENDYVQSIVVTKSSTSSSESSPAVRSHGEEITAKHPKFHIASIKKTSLSSLRSSFPCTSLRPSHPKPSTMNLFPSPLPSSSWRASPP